MIGTYMEKRDDAALRRYECLGCPRGQGDPHHGEALALRDSIASLRRLITTNYVLDELHTLLLLNIGYTRAVEFKQRLDVLVAKGGLQVVWITPELAEQAWSVFERFNRDKEWSFTDCTSHVVMKQNGVAEAFAFDHHFEQMGFMRIP